MPDTTTLDGPATGAVASRRLWDLAKATTPAEQEQLLDDGWEPFAATDGTVRAVHFRRPAPAPVFGCTRCGAPTTAGHPHATCPACQAST